MKALSLACLTSLTIFTSPVMAADIETTPPPPAASEWRYQLTLYGWAAGITGDVGVFGLPPTHINVTPIEALRHLDGALMGSFGAKNDNWLLLSDLMWVKLSADKSTTDGGSIDLHQKQLTISGLVGYQLAVGAPNMELSATVGARYQRLTMDIDRQPAGGGPQLSGEGVKQWIDPTVGLAMHYDINDRWFINALGDVGGFGVGSKFTSQAFATVGYNWSETISTALGYRAIYTDFRKGGFVMDATQHGIFASLGIHF